MTKARIKKIKRRETGKNAAARTPSALCAFKKAKKQITGAG